MQEQYSVNLLNCPLGKFLMHPVQGITGLESDHISVAEALQPGPGLGWGKAYLSEIVPGRQLKDLKGARYVEFSPAMHLRNQGMTQVLGTEDLQGGFREVPFKDFFNGHHSQQFVAGVAQGHLPVEAN